MSNKVDSLTEVIKTSAETNVDKLEYYLQLAEEMSIQFGGKLLIAVLVFIVGSWIIKHILKLVGVALTKKNVETTLHSFLLSFVGGTLKVIQIIIFAAMVGIQTASLIALLGAAGLAIGLALQGSLANFAGGILILFFKPFKVGDVIEAQGFIGTVVNIQIFNTILRTLDNQRVIMPNALLSNGCVKNIFIEETRRVELTFGISYDDDIKHAKSVIKSVLDADSRILSDPEPDIFVSAHADSSVNFLVRPWVNSDDYWAVHFHTIEEVKIAFDREGISIPFPQRDVHMIQASTTS